MIKVFSEINKRGKGFQILLKHGVKNVSDCSNGKDLQFNFQNVSEQDLRQLRSQISYTLANLSFPPTGDDNG